MTASAVCGRHQSAISDSISAFASIRAESSSNSALDQALRPTACRRPCHCSDVSVAIAT